MKREPLEKPPPLLLPPSSRPAFGDGGKSSEERQGYKFGPRYDVFHGILKRVSDMKLNGSLDSEEPSTESEKSECSNSQLLKSRIRLENSFVDERSNVSTFEDESSASSTTGSDHCPPYEEIPRVSLNRYSCASLPSPPSVGEGDSLSFRDDFFPPSSPANTVSGDFCSRPAARQYSTREFKEKEVTRNLSRPSSLCFERRREMSPSGRLLASDVNYNCTQLYGGNSSMESERHSETLADCEKHQLEMFFKSLKTEVFVCGSMANLYLGWQGGEGNWTYRHTGVVVIILDYGDTRSRRKRRIQILLAEKGTCFPLWKDTIDNLSAYHQSGTGFHTMHLSSDHRQIVGLSFDSPSEAQKLIKHIEELTSNPENINISVPGSKKKKKPQKKGAPLPLKKQISNPCLFQHVTSVAARDKTLYMSLQTLIDNEIMKKRENIS